MPIQEPQGASFDIPEVMAEMLEKHAREHGLTLDEAAAQVFARGIRKDFIRPIKTSGAVLPFRRR